jgi:hypothetical protein
VLFGFVSLIVGAVVSFNHQFTLIYDLNLRATVIDEYTDRKRTLTLELWATLARKQRLRPSPAMT